MACSPDVPLVLAGSASKPPSFFLVTSAFPADLRHALLRGLLILLGGGLQILITSLFLHLLPELHRFSPLP